MPHASDIDRILAELGPTSARIGDTLREKGIRGVRNTVRFLNPIIRYCSAQLRIDDYALDLIQRTKLHIVLPGDITEEYKVPSPVIEFLDAFNRGAYPDLELPG
jgi:hypothetical protein